MGCRRDSAALPGGRERVVWRAASLFHNLRAGALPQLSQAQEDYKLT
jgi:hypothetical protein